MHEEVKKALVACLRLAVDVVRREPIGSEPDCQGWRQTEEGHWETVPLVGHPYSAGLRRLDMEMERVSRDIEAAIKNHSPALLGASISAGKIGHSGNFNLHHLVPTLTQRILREHGPDVEDAVIAETVNTLAKTFETKKIRAEFLVPLFGVDIDKQLGSIKLGDNLVLRRLTDDDATYLYGNDSRINGDAFGIWASVVAVGEFEQEFLVGQSHQARDGLKEAEERILTVLRAIAVYGDAGIGKGIVWVRPLVPSLVEGSIRGRMGYGWLRHPIHRSPLILEADDVPALKALIHRLVKPIYPALQVACDRLLDSSRRDRPLDSIVDSVIGLEALLVGDKNPEKSFRFALNYAFLGNDKSAEGRERFQKAAMLYNLRSELVHNGAVAKTHSFRGQEYSTEELATLSRDMLREVIKTCLSIEGVPDTKDERKFWKDYWQNRYFGESTP
jgi:hypothetical protein